jgi:choline dehydrogenase
VLVLEAGPDYGPLSGGGWPSDLKDGKNAPLGSHSWNYISSSKYGERGLVLDRARVLGGCSAHNGCAAVWGHRSDYDNWAALGNPGWDTESILPLLRAANERMRVRTPSLEEMGPFHEAIYHAAPAAGLEHIEDLNDLDGDVGMAISPINVYQGMRWNASFAYLDPLRDRPNLTIRGNVLADRLVVENGRVTGVEVIGPAGRARVQAGEVVVSSGAYGSPALLLRSGIGPEDHLRKIGVNTVHALPGVGENLHDHPAALLLYSGTPELIRQMQAFKGRTTRSEEGEIAKMASSLCEEAFDLHLYPVGSPYWLGPNTWFFAFPIAVMAPKSRGTLRLASTDPESPPIMDHGYLTDPEDYDLAVLLEGLDMGREVARQPELAKLLGVESKPGPEMLDREELRVHIRASSVHYYHPVGTCKMGPADDQQAVVDAHGRVLGLQGLRVADASIMPLVPKANTNIPSVMVGERIASFMLEDAG